MHGARRSPGPRSHVHTRMCIVTRAMTQRAKGTRIRRHVLGPESHTRTHTCTRTHTQICPRAARACPVLRGTKFGANLWVWNRCVFVLFWCVESVCDRVWENCVRNTRGCLFFLRTQECVRIPYACAHACVRAHVLVHARAHACVPIIIIIIIIRAQSGRYSPYTVVFTNTVHGC